MAHKIGNLRGLSEKLIAMAERDGNDAEHELGIALVALARVEGLTEDEILDGLTAGKTHVHIESAMAKLDNDALRAQADFDPSHPMFTLRAETWEGYIPESQAGNLEDIFRFFNRVEPGDAERLEEIGYDLPSLSIGDTVSWHDKRYRVEPIGWVEVRDETSCSRSDCNGPRRDRAAS